MGRETDSDDSSADASRRSFLQTGTLASAGLALGLSGAAPAAATGGDSTGSDETPAGDAASDTELNLADVGFLQLMAYHHRGGIEAASLVPERTNHDALAEFAETVLEGQREGLVRIESILAEAGIEPEHLLEADLDAVRDMVTSIPGNLRPNELAYLQRLEGTTFDLRFIETFANHHRGAIQLSHLVLREGQSPAVEAMANDIVETQQAQIARMYAWYLDWVQQV
ncbi:DUF305 domain-containing protein [Natrinema versiforme]|uniref:DUF305 domain-containing protein n=1 Tax=Natrinema versiforme TaxID=88724 RepID=A0A4P8WIN5_9EURY|nr:DUF305 domain-containing protein [Natrinema versiforme]QCS41731.1 DUF305 domain-containing protein [Natrinema versiforme]